MKEIKLQIKGKNRTSIHRSKKTASEYVQELINEDMQRKHKSIPERFETVITTVRVTDDQFKHVVKTGAGYDKSKGQYITYLMDRKDIG